MAREDQRKNDSSISCKYRGGEKRAFSPLFSAKRRSLSLSPQRIGRGGECHESAEDYFKA
jgi:hypothetical protein